jgi:hypothetical protein
MDGEEVLAYVKTIDSMNEELSEGGCNPVFQDNIIAFWDLNEQYDHHGRYKKKKWGAIGIGDERYYKAICDIHNQPIDLDELIKSIYSDGENPPPSSA